MYSVTYMQLHITAQLAALRNQRPMKKVLKETQTLRDGCSKAKPKIFALPGGAGGPKFNQLEMVTTFT